MIQVLPARTLDVFSSELEKIQDDGVKGLYSKLLLFYWDFDDFMAVELQC